MYRFKYLSVRPAAFPSSGEGDRAGRPAADAQVAAVAIQHEPILVTRNVKDFVNFEIQLFDPWRNYENFDLAVRNRITDFSQLVSSQRSGRLRSSRVRQKQDEVMGRSVLARATVSFCRSNRASCESPFLFTHSNNP